MSDSDDGQPDLNADRIRLLKQRRGVAKGQMTRLVNWFRDHADEASVFDCKTRLDCLEQFRHNFDDVQSQIETLDATEFGTNEREVFEDQFYIIKSSLLAAIEDKGQANPNHTLNHTVNGGHAIQIEYTPPEDLPEIKLPTFDGDYLQWQQFADTFDALVHNNPSPHMTNVKRFSRLVSSLSGKALDAIRHLPVTEDNYGVAREILVQRFDNKRLIFDASIARLMSLPQAKDTRSLRSLYDGVVTLIRAMEAIANREDLFAGILTHIVVTKVDPRTKEKWEEQCSGSKRIQSWQKFLTFFEKRCLQLESMDYTRKEISSLSSSNHKNNPKPGSSKTYTATNKPSSCCMCRNNCSDIALCSAFKKLNPKNRFSTAKQKRLCIKCLKPDHFSSCCTSSENCTKCDQNHHTLLHFESSKPVNNSNPNTTSEEGTPKSSTSHTSALLSKQINTKTMEHVCKNKNYFAQNNAKFYDFGNEISILGTAIVMVRDCDGNLRPIRLLLDSGSHANFISQKVVNKLHLSKVDTNLTVSGIHGITKTLKKVVELTLKSRHSEYEFKVMAVVLPKFDDLHPQDTIDVSNFDVPKSLSLADENFNQSAPVDVLIGVHYAYRLLAEGQIVVGPNLPILQNTVLGWIVVGNMTKGNIETNPCTKLNFLSATKPESNVDLDSTLKKFWELETVPLSQQLSPEDTDCETFFRKTVRRKPDGRFVVKLPFKQDTQLLGESYQMALKFVNQLDRRLKSNPEHRELYDSFMEEYESLQHMELLSAPPEGNHCFLPYHYVLKPDSTSTKLRVVFNASAPTSSGYSLNQLMHVGPTIQSELFKVLLRFRLHRVAVVADISKMYRCIEVATEDRNFQCILVRKPNESQFRIYRLTTVTYGTASAPYLAIRCLHELAISEKDLLVGSKAVLQDIYVDDLVSGADDVNSALILYNEVSELLNRGQFPLRKVCSNNESFMSFIPNEWREKLVTLNDDEVVKTLGLTWVPSSDTFVFCHVPAVLGDVSKRSVLSETSKIFDPLGLITPVTCTGKLFMQHLWQLKIDWDSNLPQVEHQHWLKYRQQLSLVNEIKIPRYILQTPLEECRVELHVFGDASTKAYASCAYVRTVTKNGEINVKLWCAKSRVAPLKTVSLPRLELCAALLSSELVAVLRVELEQKCKIDQIYCHSDSTLTLNWISNSPHKFNIFVANRVTKIQEATSDCTWRHVRSENNPADVASRGLMPEELSKCQIWFMGPQFLYSSNSEWDFENVDTLNLNELPEVHNGRFSFKSVVQEPDLVQESKFHNDLLKTKKVFAYVFKFIKLVKNREQPSTQPVVSTLDSEDLENGLLTAIRAVQHMHFADLIEILTNSKPIPHNHPYINLSPFLDNGLLRVGGRLVESKLEIEAKFPLLLPKDHCLTRAIFEAYHKANLHVGGQSLLSFVRQKFWPIHGKVVANQTVRRCIRCRTMKPIIYQQVMGQMPSHRVNIERPFKVVGVDFFGPVVVSNGPRRAATKTYVALFVCCSTKAVHLEVTDSLTTEAFINLLQCFVGRRGVPSVIWSDNAKNFVGAANVMKELQNLLSNNQHWGTVYEWCRNQAISWKFIPPRSPHWGGLWESNIKQAKRFMLTVLGMSHLYMEELRSLLIRIEATLNSRPITPISMNPVDNQPLTPGHFLIGEPLNSIPEKPVKSNNLNTLRRFERITALRQHFVRRWSIEYLHTLQRRSKWNTSSKEIKIDTLVLMVDKNRPSFEWTIGRICKLYPGRDARVRAVDVKTNTGIYKRAVTELAPLEEDNAD